MKKWLPTVVTSCVFTVMLTTLLLLHGNGLVDATHAVIIAGASAAILTTIAIATTKPIQARHQKLMEWKSVYTTQTHGLHYELTAVYKATENRGTYPITKVRVDGQLRYEYTPVGIHSWSIRERYGKETFGLLDKDTQRNLIDVLESAKEHLSYLQKADKLATGHNFKENKLPNDQISKMLDYYKMICYYQDVMKDRIPKIIEALERPMPDSMWDGIYTIKTHGRFGHNYASENGNLLVETIMPTYRADRR